MYLFWPRPAVYKILSETAVTIGGKVTALLAQFVGIKLLTTMMTMADYGQLSLLLSASMIANLLFYGPFGQGVARFLPIAIEQHTFATYEGAVWKIAGRGTVLILMVAVAVVITDFMVEGGCNLMAILCVAALAVTDGFNSSLVGGLLNAQRKRGLAALVELFDKVKYVVAALAIYCWGSGYGVVLGSFVMTALCLLLLTSYLYRKTLASYRLADAATSPPTDYSTSILAYSSPFMIWGVFAWGQTFLERFILERHHPMADVAAYASINQLGFQTVSLGGALLMQVASPILFRKKQQEARLTVEPYRILRGFLVIMLGALLLTTLFAQDILVLLTADKYRPYADWLPWMMLAGILFASGQILSVWLMIDLETKRLLKPKLSAALVEIGLLWVLVPDYGISGVVGSSIVANAVYCGSLLLMTRSKTQRYEVVG